MHNPNISLSCCPELLISSRDEPLLQLAHERSCWNDHHGDMSEAYHGGKLRCYVHIMDQGLCFRVNTLAAYIEANRLVSHTEILNLIKLPYVCEDKCSLWNMLQLCLVLFLWDSLLLCSSSGLLKWLNYLRFLIFCFPSLLCFVD